MKKKMKELDSEHGKDWVRGLKSSPPGSECITWRWDWQVFIISMERNEEGGTCLARGPPLDIRKNFLTANLKSSG